MQLQAQGGVLTDASLAIIAAAGAPIAIGAAAPVINPHVNANYILTYAGVAAATLAAPTATVDDGVIVTLTSGSAHAHTLTATGLLNTGSANVNVATMGAYAGATVTFQAYQGKWNTLAQVAITFS